MAYDSLKAFVQQYIKQNGNQEITGPVLQNVLLQLITSLGNGFEYAGIANASTNPGSPEGQVFYITKTPGTYTNFLDSTNAPIVVPQGISILKYNGTYWALDSVLKSGDLINVNDANNQSTAYASSVAARAAVPTELRKPGLQITYLLASGWIIDQYIGSDISGWTTASNWQVLGPVSVSQNTITIGGEYAGEVSTTYDVTLHNSGATFASLEALLSDADLATLIPTNVRKGGMTIKFVQSSDNKYVQFRYMRTEITGTPNPFLDADNWQGVDEEPIAKSENLVKSGGVAENIDNIEVQISGNLLKTVTIEQSQLSDASGDVTPIIYRGTTNFIKSPCKIILKDDFMIRIVDFYSDSKEYTSDYEYYDTRLSEYVYNHNGYIRFTIKSVIEDTTQPFSTDPTISIEEISSPFGIEPRLSDIDTPIEKLYSIDDFLGGWWQIVNYQRLVKTADGSESLKYIRTFVESGSVCTMTGKGGDSGRWWYVLDSVGRISRMAEANTSGTTTITISQNESEIIVQTKDVTIIGLSVLPPQSRIDKLDVSVNKLSSNNYMGKTFSILGDSISSYGTPNANNANGVYCWHYDYATCRYSEDGGGDGNSFEFPMENMWWAKVIKALNSTLGTNESIRGSFICDTIDTDKAFCSQRRINHLGYAQDGSQINPDVILIYGGTNDIGSGREVTVGTFNTDDPSNYTQTQIDNLDVSTFANAVRAMFIRIFKTYPNAEVIVILPTFTTGYGGMKRLDDFIEVYREACDYFGVKAIDIRTIKMNPYNKSSYLLDGIHPNANCMNQIAEIVTSAMNI